ncbi:MAG: tRNA pseudouridine(55) synthase TruB, partial [Candidatus Sulfotelmatobacter sp.]
MNGVLIIDKPAGLTSHDVVNRVRRILGERSVGHLGTLDPMATGILPLVVGNLTRLAQFYTHAEKVYEGTIRFGFATDTYDAEGEPASPPQPVSLCMDDVCALAARFRGVIEQIPPPFSAKKIQGVPAYKLARKQKEVVLKPVQVEVKDFEISAVEDDRARFRARVASGTYMRSIAHDMGQIVGCGAHLESLRRTAVAEFTLDDAHTLEQLAAALGKSVGERISVSASSPEGTRENSPPVSLAGRLAQNQSRRRGTPELLADFFI